MRENTKPALIILLILACISCGFMAGLLVSERHAVADNSIGNPFMCGGVSTSPSAHGGRYQFYCHPQLQNEYGIIDTQTGIIIRMKDLSYSAVVNDAILKAQQDIIFGHEIEFEKIITDPGKMESIFEELNAQRLLFGLEPLSVDSASLAGLIDKK